MRYEMKISISLQFLIAILEDMGRDGLGKSGFYPAIMIIGTKASTMCNMGKS